MLANEILKYNVTLLSDQYQIFDVMNAGSGQPFQTFVNNRNKRYLLDIGAVSARQVGGAGNFIGPGANVFMPFYDMPLYVGFGINSTRQDQMPPIGAGGQIPVYKFYDLSRMNFKTIIECNKTLFAYLPSALTAGGVVTSISTWAIVRIRIDYIELPDEIEDDEKISVSRLKSALTKVK
jgi:hypothetical protein